MRKLEVAVISDLHLATHACKAGKVLKYLKSIQPEILVLNGDIIDSWRFSRSYFPKSHLKVVRQLIKLMEKGVQLFYVTGNHDEFLRKFESFEIGKLKMVNQLILTLDGKKTWILHGDIFDPSIQQMRWLARFGAASKGLLTIVNQFLNELLRFIGKKEIIIYKSIKKRLIREKNELSRFEQGLSLAALKRNFDTVICGHTHVPRHKKLKFDENEINYLNCGDWVENYTAAEYSQGEWKLHYYEDYDDEPLPEEPDIPDKRVLQQQLYRELLLHDNPPIA